LDRKCIKNLIFDLDGTLIDSSKGVAEATNFALKSIGEKPRPIEEISAFIGYPLEEMFASFSGGSYEQFWGFFKTRARQVVVDSTIQLDDADIVIKTLAERGYKLAIGSTKISVHISGILKKMGWDKYFSAFVGADNVSRVKPSPDVFLQAMELMKADKDETVAIGDTVNDIFAAKAAGIGSIGIMSPYGNNGRLSESNPDMLLDKLVYILDIFK
jgi:HAD superfamily hydrolase (TIGR01549 family)